MLMEWGPLPGSFGWVFPKGDVCTAGVVAARGKPDALGAYKRDFLDRHGLLDPRPLHDSGHLTRCRHPDSPLARGRVLVAGDAAALLDHWSREGISYALRSGNLAGLTAVRIFTGGGEADVSTATTHYAQQINASLGAEMRASAPLMNLFTLNPASSTRPSPACHRHGVASTPRLPAAPASPAS
ncbi:hypothetical protein [Streptomyces sp. NPDC048269]|uniref:hypothetical protein n=1 Tax=Streptomyces sp. NPDC048269 TaxID=3155753 RepID=UPI00343D54FC